MKPLFPDGVPSGVTPLEAVRDKVARILAGWLGDVPTTLDRDFLIEQDGLYVLVRARPLGDHVIIQLSTPVVIGARLDPMLSWWAVTTGQEFLFASARLELTAGSTVNVWLRYDLFGDSVDPDELVSAVVALFDANRQSRTELQSRFGGDAFVPK